MGYDPQRKHQRRRVTEEGGPAPVDALLDETAGAHVAPTNGAAAPAGSASGTPMNGAATPPERVPPVPEAPEAGYASGPDRRIIIAVAGTVVVACVLLARRRRRRRRHRD